MLEFAFLFQVIKTLQLAHIRVTIKRRALHKGQSCNTKYMAVSR